MVCGHVKFYILNVVIFWRCVIIQGLDNFISLIISKQILLIHAFIGTFWV